MNPTLNDGTVLDPKVLKVVKAIKTVEGGDYNDYTGDGGTSAGAFQWNNGKKKLQPGEIPVNFIAHAREAGLNDINDFSPASQNKVAYHIVKKWKDVDGLDPEQIAAKWNGAYRDPTTGRYMYNKPIYGERFRAALAGGQVGGTYNPPPAPQPFEAPATTGLENLQGNLGMKKEGFLSQLGQDVSNVGTGITKAVEDTRTGQINPASGFLQGAGAIAGGVGQAIDTTLSNLPLGIGKAYEFGSEKVGQAIGGAAEATGATEAFNKLSPEMRGNIGAAGNIASLFPFFKSLGTGRQLLSDASTAVKTPSLKKQATAELDEALGSSARADNLRKSGAVQELVDNNLIPDVVESSPGVYKFDVSEVQDKIQKQMKEVLAKQDEVAKAQTATYRQSELGGYAKRGEKTKTLSPLHDAIDELSKHYKALRDPKGQLELDDLKIKLRNDSITVEDINNVARKLGAESPAYLKSLDLTSQTKGRAMENLRRQLKDMVADRDVTGEMRKLDKAYSKLESQKKALMQIRKGSVKGKKAGLIRGLLKEIPGSGLVMKGEPSTAAQRLARRRPLRETARKGVTQMAVGQALSNRLGQEKR